RLGRVVRDDVAPIDGQRGQAAALEVRLRVARLVEQVRLGIGRVVEVRVCQAEQVAGDARPGRRAADARDAVGPGDVEADVVDALLGDRVELVGARLGVGGDGHDGRAVRAAEAGPGAAAVEGDEGVAGRAADEQEVEVGPGAGVERVVRAEGQGV